MLGIETTDLVYNRWVVTLRTGSGLLPLLHRNLASIRRRYTLSRAGAPAGRLLAQGYLAAQSMEMHPEFFVSQRRHQINFVARRPSTQNLPTLKTATSRKTCAPRNSELLPSGLPSRLIWPRSAGCSSSA
jgi:hypothetical protein